MITHVALQWTEDLSAETDFEDNVESVLGLSIMICHEEIVLSAKPEDCLPMHNRYAGYNNS